MGCNSELGGSPFASSIAVIPKLHISACWERIGIPLYNTCTMLSQIQKGLDIHYNIFVV